MKENLIAKKKRNAVLLFEFFQLFVLVYCNLLGKTQSHQICLNISVFPIYEQNAIAIFDQKSYHSPPPPWSLTTEKKPLWLSYKFFIYVQGVHWISCFFKDCKMYSGPGLSYFPLGVSVCKHNGRSNTGAAAELAECRKMTTF